MRRTERAWRMLMDGQPLERVKAATLLPDQTLITLKRDAARARRRQEGRGYIARSGWRDEDAA